MQLANPQRQKLPARRAFGVDCSVRAVVQACRTHLQSSRRYVAFWRLRSNASKSPPAPNSNQVAGSGTGVMLLPTTS